jgi:hypothetical protein
LWESLLPAEVLRLPDELARVDALLDDPAFFAPFAPYFHPLIGRPCMPVECCLRLMFLKYRGEKLLRTSRQRLAGAMPDGATRRVSLHEPDARPIAKGGLGRPLPAPYARNQPAAFSGRSSYVSR